MKLVRLYSNNKNFKDIEFNKGLNIILGKSVDRDNLEKDTHNIGKSSLIELLDYMLLKDISRDKNHTFRKHDNIFSKYVFYLEIKVKDNKFLTIKRDIVKSSRANFKIHTKSNKRKIYFNDWDYENISITTTKKERNAKNILNELLEFDVVPKYSYRKGLNYFLRTQKDYNSEFRLSKYNRSYDSAWKPYLFSLLGFDENVLINKYEISEKIDIQEKAITELNKSLIIDRNEIDKLKGLIQIKQLERDKNKIKIDQFDFYSKEKNINKEVIYSIEEEISDLNTKQYNLEYDIKIIKESLENDMGFDLDKTKKIFEEVNIYFSEQLSKSYEELILFNKEITEERKKYLSITLKKKQAILKEVEQKLKNINDKRKIELKELMETDSFKKFKNYQYQLIKSETEILELKKNLDGIDVIKPLEKEKVKASSNLDKTIKKVHNITELGNKDYYNIRKLFNEYLKAIINSNGLLEIIPNSKGNVEFYTEIYNSQGNITSEGDGNSYKKIMCVCFDLAILCNYSEKNYFKFVYHDGSFESLDDRKKINYIRLVKDIINKYNLQVIITAIEDDIPLYGNGKKYKFDENEIVLELSDKDETGTLYGVKF